MKKNLLTLVITFLAFAANAQSVSINTDGSNAESSAMLEVKSTTKGLLIPRMTSEQRAEISSPAKGLMVYQIDEIEGFYYYNGTVWTLMSAQGVQGIQGIQGVQGETGPQGLTGPNGQGVATGGTAGQVLSKIDGTDYNTQWITPANNDWGLTGTAGTTAGTNFIGTTDAQDLVLKRQSVEGVRLATGGAVLATGNTTTGVTPASGTGTRMMWIPAKAAFRAGSVTGTQWDNANVGTNSVAFGQNSTASGVNSAAFNNSFATGTNSAAFGQNNTASGDFSAVFGINSNASGSGFAAGHSVSASGPDGSVALGRQAVASAKTSIAIGESVFAGGDRDVAIGNQSQATGGQSMALGNYVRTNNNTGAVIIGDNSTTTPTNSTTANQMTMRFAGGYRLFGDSSATVANALTYTNTTLSTPTLVVRNGAGTAGQVLTSIDTNGTANWVTPTSSGWGLTGNAGSNATTDFIGTTDAQDLVLKRQSVEGVRLATGGSVLATGNTTTGVTPASGAGTRMMWIPAKAAFRAGSVTGTQWNNANIGANSVAFGENNIASGPSSVAMGRGNTANAGEPSAAFGSGNTASGNWTFASGIDNTITSNANFGAAFGQENTMTGNNSLICGDHSSAGHSSYVFGGSNTGIGNPAFVFGNNNTATAQYTIAMGNYARSTKEGTMSFGSYFINDKIGSLLLGDRTNASVSPSVDNQMSARFVGGYRFFSDESLTPAQTLYFTGGKLGIGTSTFGTESLNVNGTVKISGGTPGAGKVLTSDASGNATWQTPSAGGGATVLANTGSVVSFTGPNGLATVGANSYIELSTNYSGGTVVVDFTDGTAIGQILVITYTSAGTGGTTVTIYGNKIKTGSGKVIGLFDSMSFVWNGSFWIPTTYSDN